MASNDLGRGRRAVLAAVGTAAVFTVAGAMAGQAPAHGDPTGQGWRPAPRPTGTVAAAPATPAPSGHTTRPTADPAARPTGRAGHRDEAPGPVVTAEPSGPALPDAGPGGDCPPATGGAVTHAPGEGRTVALTFDDGPGDATPALLDLLRRRGVHATFFVVGGAASARPDLVAREAADGHLLGDHTWHHSFPRQVSGGWTRAYLRHELGRTDQVITTATGRPACWFRPPGGFMPATVLPVAHDLGMQVALWSVDPQDWALQDPRRRSGGTAAVSARIVSRVSAGLSQEHPLVLLHDGGGPRAATVAAVGRIIDAYRAHGYRFVRLDGSS